MALKTFPGSKKRHLLREYSEPEMAAAVGCRAACRFRADGGHGEVGDQGTSAEGHESPAGGCWAFLPRTSAFRPRRPYQVSFTCSRCVDTSVFDSWSINQADNVSQMQMGAALDASDILVATDNHDLSLIQTHPRDLRDPRMPQLVDLDVFIQANRDGCLS